jgi:roadblock/LC7 domain-containing protein
MSLTGSTIITPSNFGFLISTPGFKVGEGISFTHGGTIPNTVYTFSAELRGAGNIQIQMSNSSYSATSQTYVLSNIPQNISLPCMSYANLMMGRLGVTNPNNMIIKVITADRELALFEVGNPQIFTSTGEVINIANNLAINELGHGTEVFSISNRLNVIDYDSIVNELVHIKNSLIQSDSGHITESIPIKNVFSLTDHDGQRTLYYIQITMELLQSFPHLKYPSN